jgi:hypothetical protein
MLKDKGDGSSREHADSGVQARLVSMQCLGGDGRRICSIANLARRLNRNESTIRHALANRALSS